MFQQIDASPEGQDSYTLFSEFVMKILEGLRQMDQFDTLIGSITICETAFSAANTQDKF